MNAIFGLKNSSGLCAGAKIALQCPHEAQRFLRVPLKYSAFTGYPPLSSFPALCSPWRRLIHVRTVRDRGNVIDQIDQRRGSHKPSSIKMQGLDEGWVRGSENVPPRSSTSTRQAPPRRSASGGSSSAGYQPQSQVSIAGESGLGGGEAHNQSEGK